MYAVIRTGGKQYRVSEGDVIRVERLGADAGSTIEIDDVLMVANGEQVTIGEPVLSGARVTATVSAHGRGEKIEVVKFRRRKHYDKRTGHRQDYTELTITGIANQ